MIFIERFNEFIKKQIKMLFVELFLTLHAYCSVKNNSTNGLKQSRVKYSSILMNTL